MFAAINKIDSTKMPFSVTSAHICFNKTIKNETYQNADCSPLISKLMPTRNKSIDLHKHHTFATKHTDYYNDAINEKVRQN